MTNTNSVKTLDVSHLPPYDISNQSPLWWGQLCIDIIEGTMFLILIAAFLYVRLRVDVWPPPGDQFPHLTLPSLALIPLILSAPPAYLASKAAKKNDPAGMILYMFLNLVFAAIFFVMRLVEWHSLNFNWQTDAQGSYVWAFLGLHSFDFIADAAFTLVLLVLVIIGRYNEKVRLGVHVDTVVWYFLVAIWIPIYVVIYWGPRILGSQQ
ncbi:MAG: cytochrome c oxidase subunit 3 [Acidobacteriaceae bacterium]|nr:cytochrome c oxidase subunit 3 [Acidobacteriaceae bacterium]